MADVLAETHTHTVQLVQKCDYFNISFFSVAQSGIQKIKMPTEQHRKLKTNTIIKMPNYRQHHTDQNELTEGITEQLYHACPAKGDFSTWTRHRKKRIVSL